MKRHLAWADHHRCAWEEEAQGEGAIIGGLLLLLAALVFTTHPPTHPPTHPNKQGDALICWSAALSTDWGRGYDKLLSDIVGSLTPGPNAPGPKAA